MSESGKNRRDRAAAARDAANAGEKRRERIVRIVGAVTVLVVVVGIIGVAVVVKNQSTSDTASGTSTTAPDENAPLPTGVLPLDDARAFGVPYGTATGVPVLEIWEDFQCPACASFEAQYGPSIEKIAADGVANVIYRPTTFIQNNFPKSPNPLSSTRAASAYGCAVDAGKVEGQKFHDTVFANQPPVEGDGWTNEQLIQFGKDAGITGDKLTTFETCVNDVKYQNWANNSYLTFQTSNVPGTPALFLNGNEVPTSAYADLAGYIAANS